LSDLLARGGDLEGALIEADLAVQYNPNSVLALGQLAQVRERRQEFDQADETLRRALAIDPRNDSLLGRLASLRTRGAAAVSV
jgi:Flp pilus assembly protein TadD